MPAPPATRSSSWTLWIVVVTQLMLVLDASVVNLALTPLREDLGISATSVAWIPNAYVLAFGGLLLLGGRLGDVFGRRRAFLAGVALFTVASLLGGLASSEALLIAARTGQGVGAAVAAPSALSILLATFAEGPARNRALGLYAAMSAAGGAVGLLVGGALTSWLSWRGVFFVNVPVGVALVVLSLRFVPVLPGRPGRFDVAGAVTGTAGVTALVFGFIRAGEAGWDDPAALLALAAALVVLAGFLRVEGASAAPLLPLRLFARPATAGAYAAMGLLTAVMFGISFYLAQWLQVVLGYSAITAGVAFLPMPILIFTGSRLTPRIVGLVGPRPLAIAGATSLVAATAWLTQLESSSAYLSAAFGPLVLTGLGGGLLFMPLSVLLLSGVPPQDSGAASAAMQATQQIGGALGIAVLASVFGSTVDGADYSAGVAHAFVASTTFAVLCLLVLVVLVRSSTQAGAEARA